MRTTLTLDDDVSVRILQEQQKRGLTFRDTVNALLRESLDRRAVHREPRARFTTRGFDLGPSLIGSLDNVEEALARAEGEAHK